jgi:putative transposase
MWSRNNEFLTAPPVETWPGVSTIALESDHLQLFTDRVTAIKLYLAGENVADIQRRTGVNSKSLPRFLKNCLKLSSDGRIFGFRALNPYFRINPYVKRKTMGPKRPEQQGGQSGAFGQLLRMFPDIESSLVSIVRQEAKSRQVWEFNLRPRSLHRCFLAFLKTKIQENQYPVYGWPFNTKYRGLRTIQTFMTDLVGRNFSRSVRVAGQREAIAHKSVGTGHSPFLSFNEPFDAVEIDAHKIEAHMSVSFETPEGTHTDLLLQRLWYIAAVCRSSTAILAHTMVYRSEVTADDVLRVIRAAAAKKWVPMELTMPELSYHPDGGLPSGVIEEAAFATWSVTLLDGALVHLANKVRERARKKIGFVLNWGPVAHFERRPNVERTFKTLTDDLIRRLPSATGSHPHNGRAPNAEKKAVDSKIRANEIDQLIDVHAAKHNATPTEGLSFLSPLDYIRYFVCGPEPQCLLRRLPMQELNDTKKLASIERRKILGSIKDGRRPYIQLDRVHYTNQVLAEAGQLIGHYLIIEIDEDDYRQVHAYLDDGSDFGILTASYKWSLTKHSRRTRKVINSLISKRIIFVSEFDDPLLVYLRYLSTPEKTPRKKVNSLTTKQVTAATRVAEEAGLPKKIEKEIADNLASGVGSLTTVSQRPSLFKAPVGPPRMAKNRR